MQEKALQLRLSGQIVRVLRSETRWRRFSPTASRSGSRISLRTGILPRRHSRICSFWTNFMWHSLVTGWQLLRMHGLSEILHGASERTAPPASGLAQGHDGSAHSEEGVPKAVYQPASRNGLHRVYWHCLIFPRPRRASVVIQHMLDHLPYRNYLIEEVADTNVPAIRLYEKLGFTEYRRKPLSSMQARRSGINHMISLRLEKA